MADYNKMLIDLLNEKVLRLSNENDSKRNRSKEIELVDLKLPTEKIRPRWSHW